MVVRLEKNPFRVGRNQKDTRQQGANRKWHEQTSDFCNEIVQQTGRVCLCEWLLRFSFHNPLSKAIFSFLIRGCFVCFTNQYFNVSIQAINGKFIRIVTLIKPEIGQPNGIMHVVHSCCYCSRRHSRAECFPALHTKAEALFHMMRNPLSTHTHTHTMEILHNFPTVNSKWIVCVCGWVQ